MGHLSDCPCLPESRLQSFDNPDGGVWPLQDSNAPARLVDTPSGSCDQVVGLI
jgi:hypothetical protein